MELLTTTEMAKKWGLSRRRVTTYCTNGRIEGAIMKGNTWLIPDNAIKPEDPRRTRKNSDEIKGTLIMRIHQRTYSIACT